MSPCGVDWAWGRLETEEGSHRGPCLHQTRPANPHHPCPDFLRGPQPTPRMANPWLPQDSYQICRSLSGWQSGPWGCSSLQSCPRRCGMTSCLSENSKWAPHLLSWPLPQQGTLGQTEEQVLASQGPVRGLYCTACNPGPQRLRSITRQRSPQMTDHCQIDQHSLSCCSMLRWDRPGLWNEILSWSLKWPLGTVFDQPPTVPGNSILDVCYSSHKHWTTTVTPKVHKSPAATCQLNGAIAMTATRLSAQWTLGDVPKDLPALREGQWGAAPLLLAHAW